MNFEVFSIGTSGMMPLPHRFLTSALVRRNGSLFLFDCGECTQVSLKMLNLRWKSLDSIFISHMHADHVTGLPGLLMLSSQVDRDKPLYIYGPQRLEEYIVQNRRILDMYINYPIIFVPVEIGTIFENDEYKINCFPLDHTKECYGYSFVEKPRAGEFSVEKMAATGIPKGPLWGRVQKGESVEAPDGTIITPAMIMGDQRDGRKFSYVTDTAYFPEIADYVADSDLLFCEAMFSADLVQDAKEKKHLTSAQAATIAKDANVGKLCLQHYSPRYTDREIKTLADEARAIFPNTIQTKDRMCFELELKN